MSLTIGDLGVLALLYLGSIWLLKLGITKRVELSLQTQLERLRSTLSVRAEFSKLVAQKRLEAILTIWEATLSVNRDLFKDGQGRIEPLLEHINTVLRLNILLPKDTIAAIESFNGALADMVTARAVGDGRSLGPALSAAMSAGEALREHLRKRLDEGFPDPERL